MTDENKESNFLVVPFENLSEDALSGLIDDFILREGTEYGLKEFSLSEKHEQIKKQLLEGKILITFDSLQQTVTLITKDQLPRNFAG